MCSLLAAAPTADSWQQRVESVPLDPRKGRALHVCQRRLKPEATRTAAMDGEAWYNSFVPRVVKKEEPPAPKQHRRRESLLRQPNVSPPSAAWVR